MATYLQGVTDYIPQIQPWSPDFNFYQNALERRQRKYDIGWENVNSIYNSILNAPMLREENNQRRDKFFNEIEGEIQRLASVDLSLPQNVQTASQVFKPFYEDENIIKDIGFTKKYQDELSLAESFRKCTKEECKGKYWQGGVRALNYMAQDFVNASDEEALRMRAPEYTPYVNLMEKATAAAKDAGLSVKYDEVRGGYMVTTKNGPALQMPLMNFFMSRFGDDPELQQYYNTKAYLLTKENPDAAKMIYQYSMANPGASTEEVTTQTQNIALSTTYDNSKRVIESRAESEGNRFMALVKKRNVLEKQIKDNGVLLDSPEAKQFGQLINDIQEQDKVVGKLKGEVSAIKNTDEGLNTSGITNNIDQMRAVIASAMQMQDMFAAAQTLSYKDYEVTMKADQYALEKVRHSNRVSLAQMKNAWANQRQANEFAFKSSMQRIKAGINNGTLDALGNAHWLRGNSSIWDLPNGIQPGSNPDQSGDILMNLLQGMTDPYSGVTRNGAQIQSLIQQGRLDEAAKMAGSNSRGSGKGLTNVPQLPDVGYKTDDAATQVETTNILKDAVKSVGEDIDADEVSAMRESVKDAESFMMGRVMTNKQAASDIKKHNNEGMLDILLNHGSDVGSPEMDQAHIDFLAVGQVIDNNLRTKMRNAKTYAEYNTMHENLGLPQLSEDEFALVKGIPTNTKNIDNLSPDYFRKLQNLGTHKLIELAGGQDKLYSHLMKGEGVYVENPETGEFMNKQDANLIDDATYSEWQNMIHDEAVRRHESGNRNYKNSNITPEMRSAVSKYESFNNEISFERQWGVGSKMPSMQAFNNQFGVMNSWANVYEESNKRAIQTWNKGMRDVKQSLLTSNYEQVERILAENIIKEGDDNTPSRLAEDYEVITALAENLDRIESDPSWWTRNVFSTWGHSLQWVDNNLAKKGPLSIKARLNLLSVSEYASVHGAEESGQWLSTSKPDYENYSGQYINAIAGYKYYKDQEKPQKERQYSNLKDAVIETIKESPYGGANYIDWNDRNVFNLTWDEIGQEAYKGMKLMTVPTEGDYDESAQEFLRFLAKYGDGVSDSWGNQDNAEWRVAPSAEYFNRFAGARNRIMDPEEMSFQLRFADVDKGYLSVLEDSYDQIGTVYRDFLKQFSDQPSSLGGVFTNNEGQPLGQGSMTAMTTMLNNISPRKKDQNFYDSRDILKDAISKGEFKTVNPNVKQAIQKLYNQLDNPFTKGAEPEWNIEIHPTDGDFNKAKYTLTFTNEKWIKNNEFNKYNKESKRYDLNYLPNTIEWTVTNPEEPIAKNALPGAFDMLLGPLKIGETWTDNSLRDQQGSVLYTKTADNLIKAAFKLNLFNPATGKEELRTIEGTELPYRGTSWIDQHNLMLQRLGQIKALSDQTKRSYTLINGAADPNEVLNWYAQQLGVSPEVFK